MSGVDAELCNGQRAAQRQSRRISVLPKGGLNGRVLPSSPLVGVDDSIKATLILPWNVGAALTSWTAAAAICLSQRSADLQGACCSAAEL